MDVDDDVGEQQRQLLTRRLQQYMDDDYDMDSLNSPEPRGDDVEVISVEEHLDINANEQTSLTQERLMQQQESKAERVRGLKDWVVSETVAAGDVVD